MPHGKLPGFAGKFFRVVYFLIARRNGDASLRSQC